MNDNNALDILIKGILKSIKYSINNAKFNKGATGRIISSLGNNEYTVSINGNEYVAKSRFEYNKDDIVKIIIINNNMNELYIIY